MNDSESPSQPGGQALQSARAREFRQLRAAYAKIAEAKLRVRAAREELVQANLRLVFMVAPRHANRSVMLLDLLQEGNIGLMRAAELFDYRRGFKFGTFAVCWVRQAISRAVANHSHTIRRPSHLFDLVGKIGRTSRSLAHVYGREPTAAEVAAKLGVEVDRVDLACAPAGSLCLLTRPSATKTPRASATSWQTRRPCHHWTP